ncbi:MAG: ATP-binding cassette domain-containing protein [Planctomycetes bacterium]|nr:ATP-binding cassette domain-containing protein [Planctomycetota bacterium]
MIEIQNLTKRFGSFTAVDDVTFHVERGEVLGFLGPNGAGKSTTMKMLTGFLHPSSGTATVCGHDILADPIAVKKVIGYLPEGAPLYPDMTPRAFLEFIAEVRGFTGGEGARRVDEVIAKVNIASVAHQRIDTLSKGYKRRVGLAQAILHDPQVLVLDEPTDGLDPNQKHEVRNLIRAMAKEKVIVLSTHILEEVEAVCSRTIIIARGKVVIDCTPTELAARSRYHNAVTVSVAADKLTAVRHGLSLLDGVQTIEDLPSHDGAARFVLIPKAKRSIAVEVGQKVRDARWEVDELRVERGHLDEVFRELTQPTARN